MDRVRKSSPSPVETANLFSKVFFSWMNAIFKKGFKNKLEIEDVYPVPKEDESEKLGGALKKIWETLKKTSIGSLEKKTTKKPSLISAYFSWLKWKLLFGTCVALFEDCVIRLAQPVFLAYLIRYCVIDEPYAQTICYYMAFGIVIAAFAFPMTHHIYIFHMAHLGMKMRVASCSLLYRKALRLSKSSLDKTTAGQMVNLISTDVNRFDLGMIFINYLYVGPIQLALVTLILWLHIGVSVLAGITLIVMYIPLQLFVGKLFAKLRFKVSGKTDERIRIMTEILGAIKSIKMYAWEKSFGKHVDVIRRKEMLVFRQVSYARAINAVMYYTPNKIALLLIFVTMIVTGKDITSEKVFITVALINVVRLNMTQLFPSGVSYFAEMLVTVRRLEKVLLLDDLKSLTVAQSIPRKIGIHVEDIQGSWILNSTLPTLKNISFSSEPGTLTAIVGPVGSGKSSLLMALLGEFPLRNGSIQMDGKVAFVSQEPWVFAGTLRNNILLGQPYHKKFYDKVIEVCALTLDLKLLPYGDLTYVSDKGGSLSGGQKARVALARAVYLNADLYVLDDPLSALDICVGQHIFNKCIKEFLKTKVCILATHQVQFLKDADHIIVLECGRCIGQGTFDQLRNAEIDIVELLSDHESNSEVSSLPLKMAAVKNVDPVDLSEESRKQSKLKFTEIIELTIEPKLVKDNRESKSVKSEIGSTGVVNLGSYIRYFRVDTSVLCLLAIIFGTLLAQTLYSGSDYWLKIWTDTEYVHGNKSSDASSHFRPYEDPFLNAYIYAGLVAATLIVSLIRAFAFYAVCIASSTGLHERMINSVIRSPMSFFDSNPVGRILNRFSRDMGSIDDQLPTTYFECFNAMLNIIAILIVIAIGTPLILLVSAFLLLPLYYIRKVYLHTMINVRRLEGISRSPVYSHMNSSLQGLPVIRAFKAQAFLIKQFDQLQDVHSATWHVYIAGNRWLAIRLDLLCATFIAAVVGAVMFYIKDIRGSDVGLAISSALLLTNMFQVTVRQSTDVENLMISVERIFEYCDLPPEAQFESKPQVKKSLIGWPQHGEIKMVHVKLSYDENGPFVLNDINITIRPNEKVGIVGRSGAGKSSIIAALLRLKEAEGEIIIDGVSIKDIGLYDLRKRISIIPQDPFLFSGTVRQNLDHFQEHSDDQVWQVLQDVQLKSTIQGFENGLEAIVSEGGCNFSCGQRQLICLARAILTENKICILDEATANVDLTTDALIQKTIKIHFHDCTVLTIAHRLQTVMDSDRILVLEAGRVAEFDEPNLLLKKENGVFRSMLQNGSVGSEKTKHLRKVAKQKRLAMSRRRNSSASCTVVDDEFRPTSNFDATEDMVAMTHGHL